MRITGILQTIGDITTCEHNTDPRGPEYDFQHLKGIIITTDNDDTLRAASNLLCATVDIYPHPVDGLQPGECTPERYAHALARLAHTEDHLTREVRSSQATAQVQKNLERHCREMGVINRQYSEELAALKVMNDNNGKALLAAHLEAMDAECRKQLAEQEATKAAAWAEYLNLRQQIREAPEADKTALVARCLEHAREYDLDPTTLELEDARRTIAVLDQKIALTFKDIADAEHVIFLITRENEELRAGLHDTAALLDRSQAHERTITNMQGTINELVRQNDDLRAANDAHLVSRHALAAKQAEQERLMTAYRVQYHEADRALRQAYTDLEDFEDTKAILAQCVPPEYGVVPATSYNDDVRAAAWDAYYAQAQAANDDDEGDDDALEVMDKA